MGAVRMPHQSHFPDMSARHELYVCAADIRRIEANVPAPDHIADDSVYAKVCSQCRFLPGISWSLAVFAHACSIAY